MHTIKLTLADVRALLADRLRGRPTRANFRTGELTMCSMVPMRSVPHRVVCLLGLDDGRFPGTASVDGDDVLARDPWVGERDPRSEDRQLLLDAILAAKDHLVVLYTGADPRTERRGRPPSPSVRSSTRSTRRSVQRTAVQHARTSSSNHPLQPFDARSFVPENSVRTGARSASTGTRSPELSGPGSPASSAAGSSTRRSTHQTSPMSRARRPDRVPRTPPKAFLRQRLGVNLVGDDEELDDALAVELDALSRWAVGDRLLRARLTGADALACVQAEWRRQTLPPGESAARIVDGVMAEVELLVIGRGPAHRPARSSTSPSSRRPSSGRHRRRHYDGTVVRGSTPASPKHRLRAWGELLALSVAHPDTTWTAVTVGRDRRRARPDVAPWTRRRGHRPPASDRAGRAADAGLRGLFRSPSRRRPSTRPGA